MRLAVAAGLFPGETGLIVWRAPELPPGPKTSVLNQFCILELCACILWSQYDMLPWQLPRIDPKHQLENVCFHRRKLMNSCRYGLANMIYCNSLQPISVVCAFDMSMMNRNDLVKKKSNETSNKKPLRAISCLKRTLHHLWFPTWSFFVHLVVVAMLNWFRLGSEAVSFVHCMWHDPRAASIWHPGPLREQMAIVR